MKYVLVTGAFGGMGSAAVEELTKRGFCVFALDKTVKEDCKDGVIPVQVDVTDEASIAAAAERIKTVTDVVFAVVHFAGVYTLNSLIECSSEEFERVIKINFIGATSVNRVFAPFLRRGGRILMITSELAPLNPLPFTGIYAISKAALDKYAYSLKMELQLLGISVSVLRAGAVDTGMLDVSTACLDSFCAKTKLYDVQSARFRKIVESVEAKKISPQTLAKKVVKILTSKRPKFAYSINRNFLLLLLNALPKGLQFKIIKKILNGKKEKI